MSGTFRRAVITGGAGFLGARLCRRLLESGTRVTCLDNLLTGSRRALPALRAWPGFEFRQCDVTEPFGVEGGVDLVLHLASAASPAAYARFPLETLEAGSRGTRHALALAERKGARFILASTSEVYGDPQVRPQPESYWGNVNPTGPRSVYDEAKRFAEAMTAAYARAGRADTGIARIFNAYGPGMRPDDGRMVPTFACQALRGEPVTVTGDGSQTRSLCHADDTVRGLLLLAASGLAGPVNIGNPEEATVLQIAMRIISLARSALGFEPRICWPEGLAETIAWFSRVLQAPDDVTPDGWPVTMPW